MKVLHLDGSKVLFKGNAVRIKLRTGHEFLLLERHSERPGQLEVMVTEGPRTMVIHPHSCNVAHITYERTEDGRLKVAKADRVAETLRRPGDQTDD